VDGRPASTLDLNNAGFALLVRQDREAWQRAADDVGQAVGVPIAVPHLPAGELERADEPGATAPTSQQWSAALVRPDGVLAWMTGEPADQVAQRLPGMVTDMLSAPGTPLTPTA
jgi:hypothetical protein